MRMLQKDEVRWFAQRSSHDDRGPESYKDRPCAVLSDTVTNRYMLGIVTFLGSNGSLPLKIEPPMRDKVSHADLRQLWTFPCERDTTRDDNNIHLLGSESAATVRRKLTERLTPKAEAINPNQIWSLGRVVFVRLIASTREGFYTDGDFASVRRTLKRRFDFTWVGAEPDLLHCVVIANRQSTTGSGGRDLVTVVPLVAAPALEKDSPVVALPDGSGKLAALTQCLLTVSCADAASSIHASNGDIGSWIVSLAELAEIIQDVGRWLDLEVPCPTIRLE